MMYWIKCSERMPEEYIYVLVAYGGFVSTSFMHKGIWAEIVGGRIDKVGWSNSVTHWMPLPMPPDSDGVCDG